MYNINIWPKKAFVEATPISVPQCIGRTNLESLAIELSITLTTPQVFIPFLLHKSNSIKIDVFDEGTVYKLVGDAVTPILDCTAFLKSFAILFSYYIYYPNATAIAIENPFVEILEVPNTASVVTVVIIVPVSLGIVTVASAVGFAATKVV